MFEPEVKSQNKGTLCKLKMTFSGRHQRLSQHLEEGQEDKPHDQIQVQGPTKETIKVNMTFKFQSSEKIKRYIHSTNIVQQCLINLAKQSNC